MYIDKTSETLKVIQHMRDEAHRFGITHHRNKRSKQMTQSQLGNIQGIGEKTTQQLLAHFKSVKKIKEVDKDQLAEVIGQSKAKIVFNHFHNPND
jgi:excinuclease ABC subunit C